MSRGLLLFIVAISTFSLLLIEYSFANDVVAKQKEDNIDKQPTLTDSNLRIELVSSGLKAPTSIAFLGNKDLLVLELFNGTVRRIINDTLLDEPLLDVNVAKVTGERGMLGVTTSKNIHGSTYVFLYYTESKTDNGEALGNRLYRYELVNNKLINPKLLLNLPVKPGPYHNGGSMVIGPDNNLYLTIGDLDNADDSQDPTTKAQNVKNGDEPNGSGGILRITQDGGVVGSGIIGKTYPLNLYYAYGIRNSFGIDFDPLTGTLWDTENGPNFGDEINLVKPGFNSGWLMVQGIWYKGHGRHYGDIAGIAPNPPNDLVDFNGRGKYSAPEFIWKNHTGPTALKFLDSVRYGKDYENDLFVGNMHNGSIYHFELNKERDDLILNEPLEDRIANNSKETQKIIFAQGFEGGITDMDIGPDGYLYVASGIWSDDGKIYRIIPKVN